MASRVSKDQIRMERAERKRNARLAKREAKVESSTAEARSANNHTHRRQEKPKKKQGSAIESAKSRIVSIAASSKRKIGRAGNE